VSALVGLDVGTTGVKAVAVSPDGEIVARAEEEYPLATPQPGWVEQDPDDWRRAADAALGSLGVDEIAGIGLSGQMHGLVALDADERVLRPGILWNDQRTGAECREIEERVGAALGEGAGVVERGPDHGVHAAHPTRAAGQRAQMDHADDRLGDAEDGREAHAIETLARAAHVAGAMDRERDKHMAG